MGKKTDNNNMRLNGDFFTLAEMASILGISQNTIKKRILRLGIKAAVKDALYKSGDFENIKNIKVGRPKKDKPAPRKKPPLKNISKKSNKK